MTHLLLVDDEVNLLAALKRVLNRGLQRHDLTIDTFSDPQAALIRAAGVPDDLVVSDYRMPTMDGVSFLKHFRQIQPDVPRIILSATTDFATLMAAVNEAGIHRYLVKPWDDDEIVAVVRDALSFHDRTIEDRLLAEQKRSERGQLTPEEIELRRLEQAEPGITQVRRGPDGAVLLDDE